jgi:prepilin peptidase CpaA
MPPVSEPVKVVLAVLGAGAMVWDLRFRRIPNWLTLSALAAGVVLNVAAGRWLESVKGLALALAIHLPLFALRFTGGGDVKLWAAAGALLGPSNWVVLFAFDAVLGGVAAIVIAVRRGRLRRVLSNVARLLGALFRMQTPSQAAPELDVAHAEAITLPRGAVVAAAIAAWLVISPAL